MACSSNSNNAPTPAGNFCFISEQQSQHSKKITAELSAGSQLVLEILPYLLSVNHPELPGYVSGYPLGKIVNYQARPQTLVIVNQLFAITDCSLIKHDSIDGIYTIGSVGSVGQSRHSDWDIWVCFPLQISVSERQYLADKCHGIEHWAAQVGAELHLFMVSQDQFHHGSQLSLDQESSGSAQHWLLLDEFYRSALTLAGKPIAWQQPQLSNNTENYVDFGDIPVPPAKEYFGAMLWQLYKGIDSPEKSLLKALLLESYFSDFPHTELLSQQWKRIVVQQKFVDHYLLLLQRISIYLTELNDPSRLELVRECFYLKCAPGLSYLNQKSVPTYQQQQLQILVNQWQFSATKIAHLDRASRWDPVAVQQHHHRLVTALLTSHQRLKAMAQHHQIDEALYPQEMAILSRRLYSAYQSSTTKINQLPSKALTSGKNSALYIRRAVSTTGEPSWLLLNQAPVFGKDYQIHQDKELIKLISWAAINNYCGVATQVKLPADISHWSPKLRQALQAIHRMFSTPTKATKNALVQAAQVEQVVIILNMRADPTRSFHGQELIMNWIKSNLFSIGHKKYSLLSSIDIVYRNSWQEHHAVEFSGDQAILDFLSYFLSLISSSSKTPNIQTLCVGENQQRLLSDKVLFLLKECLAIRKKSTKTGIKVKSLVVAGKLFGLFFHPDKVEYQEISNALELYRKLTDNPLTQIPTQNPADSKINQIITEYASSGYVQFFLEQQPQGIQVYVLDEQNNFSSYFQDDLDESQLIKSIYRFYTFTKDTQNISQEKLEISFNLPQFSRIKRSNSLIIIEPFDRHADEGF